MKMRTEHKRLKIIFAITSFLNRFWALIFVLVVPLIFHFLYSKFGLNPTDDGYTLALCRRVLEGELPHIDFITIRPAGSAFLHLPIVVFGQNYAIYLSRLFVWFQFAFISVATITLSERLLKFRLNFLVKFLLATLAIFLMVHNFPIMAWHTVDGMFIVCLGLIFATRTNSKAKFVGYFLIGFSYLCKQNFFFIAIGTPFILGNWRNWKNWLSLALPGFVYLFPGLFLGGFGNYISQLTTQSGLRTAAVSAYENNISFLQKIPLGLIAAFLIFYPATIKLFKKKIYPGFFIGSVILFLELFKIFTGLSSQKYLGLYSFQLA